MSNLHETFKIYLFKYSVPACSHVVVKQAITELERRLSDMTANQIAYWNMRENERSNRARETEENRSNLVREAETERSNRAKEYETFRHNFRSENETERHNKKGEAQKDRELDESERHSKVLEYWQGFAEMEKQRHNIKLEDLQKEGNQINWFNAISGDWANKKNADLRERELAEKERAAKAGEELNSKKITLEHNDRARSLLVDERKQNTAEYLQFHQSALMDANADYADAQREEIAKKSEREDQYLSDTKYKTELLWEQYYTNKKLGESSQINQWYSTTMGGLTDLLGSAVGIYGSNSSAAASRYAADSNYAGQRYNADMNYAGRVYSADDSESRKLYE